VQSIDPVTLDAAKKAFAAKTAVERGAKDEKTIAAAAAITPQQEVIATADIRGNRKVLKVDSLIPAAMAVIYLFLILYFKAIGGYRPLTVEESK
jgi:hypothetical protein